MKSYFIFLVQLWNVWKTEGSPGFAPEAGVLLAEGTWMSNIHRKILWQFLLLTLVAEYWIMEESLMLFIEGVHIYRA